MRLRVRPPVFRFASSPRDEVSEDADEGRGRERGRTNGHYFSGTFGPLRLQYLLAKRERRGRTLGTLVGGPRGLSERQIVTSSS